MYDAQKLHRLEMIMDIRSKYRELIAETFKNTISEGAADEATKAARLKAANKTHAALQDAVAADRIVTIRARKQPRFEDPAMDVHILNHQGQLMLVDSRGVGRIIQSMVPSESGHVTVVFPEKGGRATKPLHLHGGFGGEGDFIETEKEASPYRVALVGGKHQFKGLPDLSEDANYCYQCELENLLEFRLFNKKKDSTIATAIKGTLGGLALAGAVIGGHKLATQQSPQQPTQMQVSKPLAPIGSGQATAQTKQAPQKQRMAHEMAARVIREREGFESKAYNKDGKWTIGWGNTFYSTGKPVKEGDTITREQAENEFEHHIHKVVVPKMEKIPHWDKMSEHQRAALISFSYNTGQNFYGRKDFETITDALSSPDNWHKVGDAMKLYNKGYNPDTGKKEVLRGLNIRRGHEATLWGGSEPDLSPKPRGR